MSKYFVLVLLALLWGCVTIENNLVIPNKNIECIIDISPEFNFDGSFSRNRIFTYLATDYDLVSRTTRPLSDFTYFDEVKKENLTFKMQNLTDIEKKMLYINGKKITEWNSYGVVGYYDTELVSGEKIIIKITADNINSISREIVVPNKTSIVDTNPILEKNKLPISSEIKLTWNSVKSNGFFTGNGEVHDLNIPLDNEPNFYVINFTQENKKTFNLGEHYLTERGNYLVNKDTNYKLILTVNPYNEGNMSDYIPNSRIRVSSPTWSFVRNF